MRKITEQAVQAFLNRTPFKRFNTLVLTDESGDDSGNTWLILHGNNIAQLSQEGDLRISVGGWDTVTTRERLNGLPGVSMYHKDHKLYLNGKEWDGRWIKI